MEAIGEKYNVEHLSELLEMVDGLHTEDALKALYTEEDRLKTAKAALDVRSGKDLVEHGVLWTRELNVRDVIKAATGVLMDRLS